MQTRRQSLIESSTGIVIGFLLSLAVGAIVFPLLGWEKITIVDNLAVVSIFTVFSFLRAYGLRRFFEWLHRVLSNPKDNVFFDFACKFYGMDTYKIKAARGTRSFDILHTPSVVAYQCYGRASRRTMYVEGQP